MNAWTLKLVAACMLTVCCAMAGRGLCIREKKRVQVLGTLRLVMPILAIEMTERLTPLMDAMIKTRQPLLMHIAEHMDGRGARSAWQLEKDALMGKGGMIDCLLPQDVDRLDMLFDGLGASGISAQKQLLLEMEAAFSGLESEAKKRADERGKLYTNLGLLAGLAISICLL